MSFLLFRNSEENAANDCLETKLTLDNLKQLQTIFADADNGSEENKMELQQFIDTIRKVTNSDAYQEQATRIFEQVNVDYIDLDFNFKIVTYLIDIS